MVDSKENFKFDLGVKGLMPDTGVLIFKEKLGWTHTCVFKGKRFCQFLWRKSLPFPDPDVPARGFILVEFKAN